MRNPRKIICLDVETTDKDPYSAEILQLSIIDYDGNVLFNHYIKPDRAMFWPGAERINHISPLKVAREKKLDYYKDELDAIFDEADLIVAYNGDHYDIPVIARYGFDILEKKSYDVMLEFAPIYGAWDDYHGSYTWQKLIVCADYYGYRGEGDFHDSLEDIRATLFCYKKMTDEEANEKILQGEDDELVDDLEYDSENDYDTMVESDDNDYQYEIDEDGDQYSEYDFVELAKKVRDVEDELTEKYCELAAGIMDKNTAEKAVSKPRVSLFVYGFTVACDNLRELSPDGEIEPSAKRELIDAFKSVPHPVMVELDQYTEPGISKIWLEQSIMNFGNLVVFAQFFNDVKQIVDDYFNEYY